MKLIRAPFDRPQVLEKLRPAYRAERSLILPGACDPHALHVPRMRTFYVANRGRYEMAELKPMPELRAFAEALTGARLKAAWLRLFRFRRGGYSLFYDDALTRIDSGVELTLDLSRAIAGIPIVYQTGPARLLPVPQAPGIVSVVERTEAVFRYDRYLPAAVGRASVLRLRAAFHRAD